METEKLASEVEKFIDFIQSLPKEKLEFSKTRDWRVHEVLIHLVLWHEEYVKILESEIKGTFYQKKTGTFKENNSLMVKENRKVSFEELISRWRKAERKFEKLLENKKAKNLTMSFREGSKEWPLEEVVRLIPGHIENHLKKLKRKVGEKSETKFN